MFIAMASNLHIPHFAQYLSLMKKCILTTLETAMSNSVLKYRWIFKVFFRGSSPSLLVGQDSVLAVDMLAHKLVLYEFMR